MKSLIPYLSFPSDAKMTKDAKPSPQSQFLRKAVPTECPAVLEDETIGTGPIKLDPRGAFAKSKNDFRFNFETPDSTS